jgi:hypothetical protein
LDVDLLLWRIGDGRRKVLRKGLPVFGMLGFELIFGTANFETY